ncbi:Inactive protein kinase SELMODRAFT [Sesamum angolense]|uniref:non-specific serine/threonine protein kinase n=1 Tax=Sesamum angolense TaxID=2727404 RepID=A0AAE1WC37_9LAMI|nr:Inactive protein kinase SELMODRAFT [Sesamum angolense]
MFPPKPPVTGQLAGRGGETAARVIVAVKAEKVISKSGLAWALNHAARPGDCVMLLAVFSEEKTGRRFWGFPRLKGDGRSGDATKLSDRICHISESCSQMVLQVQDQIQVSVRIKVVSAISAGAVAAEAKSSAANWVILDKKLKRELRCCVDELHCNIVVMKGSHPKVLRLNLASSDDIQTPFYSAASSPVKDNRKLYSYNMKHTTPVSSPEDPNSSYTRSTGENSLSSPDAGVPTFVVGDSAFNSSIREAVSLSKISSTPPPLCSLCQSKAPAFGKPPKQFQYKELEEATDGFSDKNFVAEGGYGLVHRGVLRNGLVIAVKQLKLVGPQRDADFCREVRVLSCAQHRNVVLLIGFCIEGKKRLLVYEYICNSSLDFHLHGNEMSALDWQTRLRIAIGTARGLRYLHEDCRVGCIIHRNLRPNNILLTHDFEPLVADFGLARLHSEWKVCDRKQVVGTSAYLAPEYFNDGKITEKVDIYAFGMVLLELITGQRAHDLQYCMKHQFLRDDIHSLATIEPIHILVYKHQLLDPRLASIQPQGLPYELHAIGFAASLCLQPDPDLRPPMSKVVKVLEGGSAVTPLALDLDSVGCRNGHMRGLNSNALLESKRRHSRRLSY